MYWVQFLWMSPCTVSWGQTPMGQGLPAGLGVGQMGGGLQPTRKAAAKVGNPLPVSEGDA